MRTVDQINVKERILPLVIINVHETTDTDPGMATSRDDCSLERYILEQNHDQIELLVISRI
jgi:hypothetical protein